MDIAKANSAKNRYHNIHTCESENANVYDTYNVDTELACKYSLWCSKLVCSLNYLPSSLTWAIIGTHVNLNVQMIRNDHFLYTYIFVLDLTLSYFYCQASDSYVHTCAFFCLFPQTMLRGSSCLCQIRMEVTTSTPHLLMYVNECNVMY